MKPKKIFSKLFPAYFLISLLGVSIVLLIARFAFKNFYYNEISNNLLQKARLIEDEIKINLNDKNNKILQEKILHFAEISESRITVISPKGEVLADSNFNPIQMENHLDRDEVKIAIDGKVGKSIRFSPTLKEKHLYIAIAIKDNGVVLGVLRNSVSVITLQTSLFQLTQNVLFWSFILLLILTYFIFNQAKKISQPLEELKIKVDKFSSSNFEEKIEIEDAFTIEFESLFNAVGAMSEKLKLQFQKINKQKNEQLAVFGSMLEGVITIYPDLKVYHINQSALDLFSYSEKTNIKGTPLLEIVKSVEIFKMAAQLLRDQKSFAQEFEYGEGVTLDVKGTILNSEDTELNGAVLVFNDISKMRALENHRTQFVANVSHELKTPLTAIQGYLETIRDGDVEDINTIKKFLNIVDKHSIRLKTIIDDLLSLSSLERETDIGELQFIEENIQKILKSVVSLCNEKTEKKNIRVLLEGPEHKLKVNRALMEQAVLNLLDNAVKYGPENSRVIIKTLICKSHLQIIVEDEGRGISKEHHERLFERFYSVDKARSRELGGSGLGLAIVKHIAISHGGSVRVESQLGEGSRFIIELPLKS